MPLNFILYQENHLLVHVYLEVIHSKSMYFFCIPSGHIHRITLIKFPRGSSIWTLLKQVKPTKCIPSFTKKMRRAGWRLQHGITAVEFQLEGLRPRTEYWCDQAKGEGCPSSNMKKFTIILVIFILFQSSLLPIYRVRWPIPVCWLRYTYLLEAHRHT